MLRRYRTKICPVCGRRFTPTGARQICCSPECKAKFKATGRKAPAAAKLIKKRYPGQCTGCGRKIDLNNPSTFDIVQLGERRAPVCKRCYGQKSPEEVIARQNGTRPISPLTEILQGIAALIDPLVLKERRAVLRAFKTLARGE